MRTSNCVLSCILMVLLVAASGQADWLSFRGTTANLVASGKGPTKCDDENIAWEAEIPGRGVSSPIVVGDQVIVTASSGPENERIHVISVDGKTGKQRWHRQFWATGRTITHPTSANAAPTPASDGEHIVAFFSSNDIVCLGLDGELIWYRGLGHDYPKAGNDIGMASSPVVAAGVVVCQVENQGDSFAEGIDIQDGTTLWRTERPADSNWTSPVYLPGETDLVLLKCDEHVSAHDIRTGETVWQIAGEVGGVPSMVVAENLVYVPGSTFTVIDANKDASIAWDSQQINASTSPIVHDGRIYTISGSVGILKCFDADDGKQQWQTRVGGKYWASPVLAGDYIYLANQSGELHIVQVSGKGKKVDSHDFGEELMGTPAISDGALYVRSTGKLWKVMDR